MPGTYLVVNTTVLGRIVNDDYNTTVIPVQYYAQYIKICITRRILSIVLTIKQQFTYYVDGRR